MSCWICAETRPQVKIREIEFDRARISGGPYLNMILYGFHVISICFLYDFTWFHMILYRFHMISYAFNVLLYGVDHIEHVFYRSWLPT